MDRDEGILRAIQRELEIIPELLERYNFEESMASEKHKELFVCHYLILENWLKVFRDSDKHLSDRAKQKTPFREFLSNQCISF